VTSREQALLQLGLPTGAFEADRIMTWRLVYNGEQLLPLAASRATEDPRYTVWPAPPTTSCSSSTRGTSSSDTVLSR
jgi:hypothetical protein